MRLSEKDSVQHYARPAKSNSKQNEANDLMSYFVRTGICQAKPNRKSNSKHVEQFFRSL
jgi:hypothetical protein